MTERARFNLAETTLRVWQEQGGKCFTCGRIHGSPEGMELAHVLPQGEMMEGLYGAKVIHSRHNLRGTCRGRSECNSAVSIGKNAPATEKAHVAEILRLIEEENRG